MILHTLTCPCGRPTGVLPVVSTLSFGFAAGGILEQETHNSGVIILLTIKWYESFNELTGVLQMLKGGLA